MALYYIFSHAHPYHFSLEPILLFLPLLFDFFTKHVTSPSYKVYFPKKVDHLQGNCYTIFFYNMQHFLPLNKLVSSPKHHFFVFFSYCTQHSFSMTFVSFLENFIPKGWKHTTVTPFKVSNYTTFQGCACLNVSHLKLSKYFHNIFAYYVRI